MSITVSIATSKQDLPPGKTAGLYEVTMSFAGDPDVVMTSPDGATLTFPAMKPGTYTFVAVRLDSDGNDLSQLVSGSIVVPPVVVQDQFDAPVSITLALG